MAYGPDSRGKLEYELEIIEDVSATKTEQSLRNLT